MTTKNVVTPPPLKAPTMDVTLGLTATLGPYSAFDSASRLQMVTSHTGQALGVRSPDIPRIMTGFEGELAKYTFKTKMPEDAYVVSIHHKYKAKLQLGVKQPEHQNPLTTIIFQNASTGEYDCIDIEPYSSHHDVFTHKYVLNPQIRQIVKGQAIPAGTVLAESPNVHQGNIYGTGIQAEMVYLSTHGVTEDSYVISDELAEKASPIEYRRSVASWGKNHYPLNIYGDDDDFKAFPDLGEKTRSDGLIFALRESNVLFDCVEKAVNSLSVVDTIFDKLIYGLGDATVFDIEAETGKDETRHNRPIVPEGMAKQAEYYIQNTSNYYDEIVNVYTDLYKSSHGKAVISPRLQNRVVRGLADQPNSKRSRGKNTSGIIRRTHRDQVLDAYRVKVSYCAHKRISPGAKFTGRHGNKGVVGDIWPKANMPTDAAGNVADIIGFSKGAVSRLNAGQFYEQFVSAAIRDMTKVIKAKIDAGDKIDDVWNVLERFYHACSPTFGALVVKNYKSIKDKDKHLQEIYANGIYIALSPSDQHLGPGQVKAIRAVIEPTYTPVTYTNEVGVTTTTKEPAFIGELNFILLEKTHHTAMSTSSTSLQQHGLVSGSSRSARESYPVKRQSTRVFGETEVRLIAGSLGSEPISEFLDHANSPDTHREVVTSILRNSETNMIPKIVNRRKNPVGASRAQGFIRNILECRGTEIVQIKGAKWRSY